MDFTYFKNIIMFSLINRWNTPCLGHERSSIPDIIHHGRRIRIILVFCFSNGTAWTKFQPWSEWHALPTVWTVKGSLSGWLFRVRFVVENCFHFPRKRFQKMELNFHFQFSMKILENMFGWNGGVFIFHFRISKNVFRKFWKTTKKNSDLHIS